MKTTMIILLCTIFIFCSCEGKRGLTGATGDQGDQDSAEEIEIITGILSSADYESYGFFATYYGFWSISINRDLTNCIVTVNVRVDNTIAWQETPWSMGTFTIFIFDDDDVDMGYEYRIAIAQ